jgi:hypothetical protein
MYFTNLRRNGLRSPAAFAYRIVKEKWKSGLRRSATRSLPRDQHQTDRTNLAQASPNHGWTLTVLFLKFDL